MVDHRLISFIEAYNNKDTSSTYNIFSVNYITRVKDSFHFGFGREDIITITLDNQDLKYLFDKYHPKYAESIAARQEKLKKKREEEIKELEDKINKLRNENI